MSDKWDIKNNILDSFIFYEVLAEGNLSKDAKILTYDKMEHHKLKKLMHRNENYPINKNAKLALYFNVLSFEKVLKILKRVYRINIVDEDIDWEKTFEYALVFDYNLEFIPDETFVSIPYYIYKNQKINYDLTDLKMLTIEISEQIKMAYEECENDLGKLLHYLLKSSNAFIKADSICFEIFNSKAEMNAKLHSFYLEDLETAKHCSQNHLLKRYFREALPDEKINLDSKTLEGQNNIKEILAPCNYPLGRFPSDPSHAPSLMQQVAINLRSQGKDYLLTVNGPPGTGKTTLLKDVFADLIVQTSREIAERIGNLSLEKKALNTPITNNTTRDQWSISILPPELLKSNILLASSNNTALENIVIDFSKENAIYSKFETPDYFPFKLKRSKKDSEPIMMWGSFSYRGGNKDNRTELDHRIEDICKELDEIATGNNEYTEACEEINLQSTCEEFNQLYDQVQKMIDNAQDTYTVMVQIDIMKQKINHEYPDLLVVLKEDVGQISVKIDEVRADLEKSKEEHEKLKLNKPKYFAIKKLFKINEATTYSKQISSTKKKQFQLEKWVEEYSCSLNEKTSQISEYEENLRQCKLNMQLYKEKLAELKQSNTPLLDFSLPYDELEKSVPWFNDDFRIKQSQLFTKALEVRKAFLYKYKEDLKTARNALDWDNKIRIRHWDDGKEFLVHSWNWINFAIPVISTTFASMHNMFDFAGANTLPNLFIDEAGQAAPQACIGGLLRAERVMALGDPFQIEPVKTLDSQVLGILQNHFRVSDTYLAPTASCQTILDSAGKYGFQKDEETWIGVPLWVHRRCADPMFSISNAISYDGRMVLGVEKNFGIGKWCDVKGIAKDKFVQAQACYVIDLLTELIEEGFTNKQIYIITPFRNVAQKLREQLGKAENRHLIDSKKEQIGTVHTFQGKENKVVILVLGADENSSGAAAWVVKKPNIMNVAATRAKERLYIIGDKQLYKGVGGKVVKNTLRVINKYNQDESNGSY